MNKPYNSFNNWLLKRFGERVFKVMLETGLSCPNIDGTISKTGCIFCNQEALRPNTTRDEIAGKTLLSKQLLKGIDYVIKRHNACKVISHFSNGTNTHAPARTLRPLFFDAISHPSVVGLAVSTRPDCISDNHIQLFYELNQKTLFWIELGLQSAHDSSLRLINRGHTARDFQNMCTRLHERGIMVCAHVILGLPGEGRKEMLATAQFLNNCGVWGVKIHNLHVLKDTELESLYHAGKVKIPSLEEYAHMAVDFMESLSPSIVIHRFQSHSPHTLTVAPLWSINKLAIVNAVEEELAIRDTRQGKKYQIQATLPLGTEMFA